MCIVSEIITHFNSSMESRIPQAAIGAFWKKQHTTGSVFETHS